MHRSLTRRTGLTLALAASAGLGGWAAALQTALAQPPASAPAPALPAEWPGTMGLAVDATDLDRRIVRVAQTVPLTAATPPRRVPLRFARYLPGGHGPYGDVTRLAGLVVRAGDQRLAWQRESADPFTFLVDVPGGATELQLAFQYLAPVRGSGERISISRTLLNLEWESLLLYPAGPAVHGLRSPAPTAGSSSRRCRSRPWSTRPFSRAST
jgi:hypothetical protein